MSDKKPSSNEQNQAANHLPDLDYVRALSAIMDQNGITEFEWENESALLRLSTVQGQVQMMQAAPQMAALPTGEARPAAANNAAPEGGGDASAPSNATPSPMVGTVYLSPQPGSPNFSDIGKEVKQGDTVMIIEAMKVMNQISAPNAGILKAILVQDGEPVEYGQPLFVIE
ncbi:MAG: acetyl-CoA carboxylase biotin carboxyl carrier protein [Alphaproteobacteria bacterium]